MRTRVPQSHTALPALFAALVVAVPIIYPDRRRAAWWLGGVTAGAMLFDLVMMRVLRSDLAGQATNGLVADAPREGWDTVTGAPGNKRGLSCWWRWWSWSSLDVPASASRPAPKGFLPPAMAAFLDRWGTLTSTLVGIVAAALLLFVPSMTFGPALIITLATTGFVVLVSLGEGRAESPLPT